MDLAVCIIIIVINSMVNDEYPKKKNSFYLGIFNGIEKRKGLLIFQDNIIILFLNLIPILY